MRLSETAKEDLEIFLTLKTKQIDNLVEFFSGDEEEMPSPEQVSKKLGVETKTAETAITSIYSIGYLCSNNKKAEKFLEEVKRLGLSDDQISVIKMVISKLKANNIIYKLIKIKDRLDVESFGLPHLSDINLRTDYRVLTDAGGKKELIPVVLCSINIHKSDKTADKGAEKIIFQFSLNELDKIIRQFQEYKRNMKKDVDFLKDKLSSRYS